MKKNRISPLVLFLSFCACQKKEVKKNISIDPHLEYQAYIPNEDDIRVSRSDYADKLYGFWLGKEEVEKEFGRKFTNKFNIHRTIRGFPSDGIDTFENMAQTRVFVVDRMVQKRLGGGLNLETNEWYFPKPTRPIQEAKLETN